MSSCCGHTPYYVMAKFRRKVLLRQYTVKLTNDLLPRRIAVSAPLNYAVIVVKVRCRAENESIASLLGSDYLAVPPDAVKMRQVVCHILRPEIARHLRADSLYDAVTHQQLSD